MTKVLILSDRFPATHQKKGMPTHFVDSFLNGLEKYGVLSKQEVQEDFKRIYSNEDFRKNRDWIDDSFPVSDSLKLTTIRKGNKFKIGDIRSPRIWLGLPRKKPGQIKICKDLEIKQVYNIELLKIENQLYVTISGIYGVIEFSVNVNIPQWEYDLGFDFSGENIKSIDTGCVEFEKMCRLDGLNPVDLHNWFIPIKKRFGKNNINNHFHFEGQIISFIDNDFYGLNTPEQTLILEIFDMRYDHDRTWNFIANIIGLPVQIVIDIHNHYMKYYLKNKVDDLMNRGIGIANTAKSLRITEKEVLEIYDYKDEIKDFVESLDFKGFTNK